MSHLDDQGVTPELLAEMGRLDPALRAVAAVVVPDPLQAAGILMGCGLKSLVDAGIPEEEIISGVHIWLRHYSSTRAEGNRKAFRVVPDPPQP